MQRAFAYSVLKQQPLRVAGDIARDSVKIFALTRDTEQGDTPIARWQFQVGYPYYPPGVTRHGRTAPARSSPRAGGGGHARVHRKADIALRYYQLHGGYTPGPVFLLGLLAGIAGIFTFRRRRDPGPALACLLITGCAVAVLLGADLYEFSWRYQLPALITLPVAGAFGATALARHIRARRQRAEVSTASRPRRSSELATDGNGRCLADARQPDDHADIRMLASGVVYEDNWMRLRRDEIERRDGSRGTYAFVEKRDFALVIPAENDGFHLVEEYRYPIGRRTWSFPQGGCPHGESGEPADLARLELAQETGLRARELVRLGYLHGAHGITDQAGHSSWPPGSSRARRNREPRSRTCARPGCPGPGSRR